MDTSYKEIKHGKWTPEEDKALEDGISKYGEKKWKLISAKVQGRSPIQCLHRWTKILKPGLIKGSWTENEDLILKNWVLTVGPQKWAQCSKKIPGRNGKQCRERWLNNLDPNVKKGNFTPEEDMMIFNIFQNIGPKWALISKYLPGRTENSIKNRFYSTLRKINNTKNTKMNYLEKHFHDLEEFETVNNKYSTQVEISSYFEDNSNCLSYFNFMNDFNISSNFICLQPQDYHNFNNFS